MLPFKLIYDPGYDLHLGSHVFPSTKFRMIHERLLRSGFAVEDDFVTPEAAEDSDLRLVHNAEWVRRLRSGLLTLEEVMRLEIPVSTEMVDAFWLHTGGSMLAAPFALRDRVAF